MLMKSRSRAWGDMRLKPEVWSEAVGFRCHLASEYRLYHESSDAIAARDLTILASDLKLTERTKPIHGATLASFVSKTSEMPYWAAMSALVYITRAGYIPVSNQHLDYIMAHIAKNADMGDAIELATKLLKTIPKKDIIASLNRIAD